MKRRHFLQSAAAAFAAAMGPKSTSRETFPQAGAPGAVMYNPPPPVMDSPEVIVQKMAAYTVPQPDDTFVMAQARKVIGNILKGQAGKEDLTFLMQCTHDSTGYNSKVCLTTFPVSKDVAIEMETEFGEQNVYFRLSTYSRQQNRFFSDLIGVTDRSALPEAQASITSTLPNGWKGRAGGYFPDNVINADDPFSVFSAEQIFNEATQLVEGQLVNDVESGNRPIQALILKVMNGETLQHSDFRSSFFYKCNSPQDMENNRFNLVNDISYYGKEATLKGFSSDYLLASGVIERETRHLLDSPVRKFVLFDRLTPNALYVDMEKGIQLIVPDYHQLPEKVKALERKPYRRNAEPGNDILGRQ